MILMADSAQQPTKLRISLNLLHPKEAPSKLPEKFLKWLITYGRFIVIFVEVIVVAAFLTRFKLDADLDALKIKIRSDLPYIEDRAIDEAEIKQTQTKLGLIDKIYLNEDRWQETVIAISEQIPQSIVFNGLFIESEGETSVKFRITASTFSNSDLGIFLNNLRVLENFKDINLASISFDRQQILFTITGMKVKE